MPGVFSAWAISCKKEIRMVERGTHTLQEILSQPVVWQETLASFRSQARDLFQFWQQTSPEKLLVTGCGSTYYLSLTAAPLLQALTGVPAQARPASELVFFPEWLLSNAQRILLVTISRSGETTETIEAVRTFRQYGGKHILAITCDSHSALAQSADFVLAADAAQEQSVAQTRSFSSMTLLVQAAAAQLTGLDAHRILAPLPQIGQRLLSAYSPLANRLGMSQDIDRFFFLGGGFLYGIACEAMLKMKEMSLTYSEAFHPLEFRHGPMSMVDEHSLVVGLVSPQAQQPEVTVLQHMHHLGGKILALGELDNSQIISIGDVLRINSDLPAWAQPVLYLPVLQLLAFYRALARSQDPDHPQNLQAVIQLESLK
jgi:glucosamine--fructose-6-phosphate aminotransferase (isomerizing)